MQQPLVPSAVLSVSGTAKAESNKTEEKKGELQYEDDGLYDRPWFQCSLSIFALSIRCGDITIMHKHLWMLRDQEVQPSISQVKSVNPREARRAAESPVKISRQKSVQN